MEENKTKICTKCGVEKELNEFHNDKTRKDGKVSNCKKCVKQYQLDNFDAISQKNKEYKRTHSEKYKEYNKRYHKENYSKIRERHKKYNELNKEAIAEYSRIYSKIARSEVVLFEIYKDSLTVEESPIKDENGLLMCMCSKCKEYYYPKKSEVRHRVQALKGNQVGESKLYCSEKCKQECDVYWAQTIPKSLRSVVKQVRCHQHINRKALLDLQIDECGYNYCEKCGKRFDASDLALHHNIMVSLDLGMADDMSHQLLCCIDHHDHKGC